MPAAIAEAATATRAAASSTRSAAEISARPEGVELYAKIFHVDAESKRHGETVDERFRRRARESAPLVEALRTWLDRMRGEVEPKSALGNALGYIHRQWKRLTAFMREPLMELTNNEVERDLRRWVLDRKTWLFVGHELSAPVQPTRSRC